MLEARRICGHVGVKGLFPGEGWVYLRARGEQLLILNLPSWVSESDVLSVFRETPESATLGGPERARLAHVSISADERARILEAPGVHLVPAKVPLHSRNAQTPAEWIRIYTEERNPVTVEKWAEAAMKTFEERQAARKRAEELRRQQEDADGFVTVTSGPSVESAAKALQKPKKGIEKEKFYRWQRKQKRDVEELRKKFAADKRRVAAAAQLSAPKTQ